MRDIRNKIIKKLGGLTEDDYRDMETRVQEAEKRAKEAEKHEAYWRKRVGGWEEACTRLLSENKKLQKHIQEDMDLIYRHSTLVNRYRTVIVPEYQKQIREIRLELDEAHTELEKYRVDQIKKEREE